MSIQAIATHSCSDVISRRFAHVRQRVVWEDDCLSCCIPDAARKDSSDSRIREAIDLLTESGCLGQAPQIEECSDSLTVRWNSVGKVTYWWEWPAEGWRAAADIGCRALEALKKQNLTFLGLQPWDIFMAGARPFVACPGNLGRWSIAQEMANVELIERYFARPLECARHGHLRVVRRLLRGGGDGISSEDLVTIRGNDGTRPSGLAEILGWLHDLRVDGRQSSWDTYEHETATNLSDEVQTKLSVVSRLLERLRPQSVVDIGCNKGRFSALALAAGATVTGVDADEGCMNAYFNRSLASPGIATGVVMDLCDPSQTRGWGSGWSRPAEQRLASDVMIALALVHHLVLGFRMQPTEITHCFASLCKKWLLLEFVPIVANGDATYFWGADFYTLEWLLGMLGEQFVKRESWQCGQRGRQLLLLERV